MESVICKDKYRVITKDTIVERIKVYDWLYILDEVNSEAMYLIIGNEKALLFDTGYGFTNFRHLIDEVTDLPLIVVCSHGHDDHVLGCWQFDEAYISEDDIELCMSNDNTEQREKQIMSRREKTPDIDNLVDRDSYLATTIANCNFKFIKDGDRFDLGGLTLIVYALPGHTKGSIALYCPEKKCIFTGDAIMKNHKTVYGQSLKWSAEPQEFIRALTRISELDIDEVWPAHGDVPAEPEYITETRDMLIDWAHNGDIDKDLPARDPNKVPIFGDPNVKVGMYYYKNVYMSYNEGHLEQIHKFMEEHDGAVE